MKRRTQFFGFVMTGVILLASSVAFAEKAAPLTGALGETQTGLAAYYSKRLQGRRTASGQRFDNGALTTAHPSLPYGTVIKVTNLKNNKSVVLRVNDRGPTQPKRILDVSRRGAKELGFLRAGLTEVKLEVVEQSKPRNKPPIKGAAKTTAKPRS